MRNCRLLFDRLYVLDSGSNVVYWDLTELMAGRRVEAVWLTRHSRLVDFAVTSQGGVFTLTVDGVVTKPNRSTCRNLRGLTDFRYTTISLFDQYILLGGFSSKGNFVSVVNQGSLEEVAFHIHKSIACEAVSTSITPRKDGYQILVFRGLFPCVQLYKFEVTKSRLKYRGSYKLPLCTKI